MALPSELLQQVDQITLNYTAKAYQAIVDAHRTELRLMLIVYVALFGIAVFQGTLSMSLRDATKHLLKVLIFFQLATNWGTFTTFFYDVFTHGPEKMTTAMIGGSDPNQQLEDVFVTGMEAARQIYDKAGITDLSQMFLALLVFLGTLFMVAFALFLLILSKLGLALLLSIAPLFLILAIWKSTQGLFQGWINYLVNYALIPVITFALLGLILTLMKEPLNQIKSSGENLDMVTVIPFMLVGAISTLLFSQVLRIASSLGGGIALSTLGAFDRYVNQPLARMGRNLSPAPVLKRLAGSRSASRSSASTRTSGSSTKSSGSITPVRSVEAYSQGTRKSLNRSASSPQASSIQTVESRVLSKESETPVSSSQSTAASFNPTHSHPKKSKPSEAKTS